MKGVLSQVFYVCEGGSLLYAGFGGDGRSAKGGGWTVSSFKYFPSKVYVLLLFSPGAVF